MQNIRNFVLEHCKPFPLILFTFSVIFGAQILKYNLNMTLRTTMSLWHEAGTYLPQKPALSS